MLSQTKITKKMARKLAKKAKAKPAEKPYAGYGRYKKIANHANIASTFNSLIDSILTLAVATSETFKKYLLKDAPYYVMASYYLFSGVIPMFVAMRDGCSHDVKQETYMDDDDVQRVLNHVIETPEVKALIDKDPTLRAKFSGQIAEAQRNQNIKIDLIINAIVLISRTLHGFIFGSVVNILYTLGTQVQKHLHINATEEARKGFDKFNGTFFKALHAFRNPLSKIKTDVPEDVKGLGNLTKPLLTEKPRTPK